MKKIIDIDTPVRIIGDIHGGFEEFEATVREARDAGRFVISLGDPEDRGPEPAKCVKLIMDLYDEGHGDEVMSNHKWKHIRAYEGRPVKLKLEHINTQNDINSMGEDFAQRYLNFGRRVPWFIEYGNNFFAHAAYHGMAEDVETLSKHDRSTLQQRLIYGMTTGRIADSGYPVRLLDWFDKIPDHMNVFVGHHILSTSNILNFRTTGGNAYFVDLGFQSHDGGQLAWVDFDKGEITGSSVDIIQVGDPREYGDYRVEE